MFEAVTLKSPPHFRRVPNTNYIVDCFGIDSQSYIFFLSHFHADHYGGLNKKFSSILYCSKTTANLAKKLAKKECIISLDLYCWYQIEKHNYVLLVDANHCPGAVCFIFCISGMFYFHSGDFRCANEFYSQFEGLKIENDIRQLEGHENNTYKANITVKANNTKIQLPRTDILQISYQNLYIDNTYEGYRSFDTQKNIIHKVLNIMEGKLYDRNVLIPIKYCFMFATYSVGKEKIFLTVAEHFNFDIFVSKYKLDIIKCIADADRVKIDAEVKSILQTYKKLNKNKKKKANNIQNEAYIIKKYKENSSNTKIVTKIDYAIKNVFDRFTLEQTDNCIHTISMMHLNKTKIDSIVKNLKYDKIVIFAGTGWKDMTKYFDWIKDDGRKIKGGIEVIYVPYSEHSSNEELDDFKNKMKYRNLINTVKYKY